MSESFHYDGVSHTPVGWAFITALSDLDLTRPFFDSVKPGEPIQIELKFNGFEVSFTKIITALLEHFDQAIAANAQELVNEKAADVLASLGDLKADIARHASRLFPDSQES